MTNRHKVKGNSRCIDPTFKNPMGFYVYETPKHDVINELNIGRFLGSRIIKFALPMKEKNKIITRVLIPFRKASIYLQQNP